MFQFNSDAGPLPAQVTFDDFVQVSWNDVHLLNLELQPFDIKNGKAHLNAASRVRVQDLQTFSEFNRYMQVFIVYIEQF